MKKLMFIIVMVFVCTFMLRWPLVYATMQVAAGKYHTVGLKANNSVVAVGDNSVGQCNVSSWTNIIQVSAGAKHTVGLKTDGSVVAVGDNTDGQCNISVWTNIVQVAAGKYHTLGLKADGTVVAVGDNGDGQCNVSVWTNIVQVAAGAYHSVGLKADGTVVAVGDNGDGQCNVSGWTNIIQVSAGEWHTAGLKADGTVVAVGDNSDGQCDVTGWDLDLLPPLGPVAYYPFNGNANDESGNGNNGSIYGNLKVVSGVNGNAYRFDGSSDYIQVENFKGLDRQEMTIALWVKPDADALPSTSHNLISKHGDLTNIEMLILQEKDLKYDIEWTIGNAYYDLTSRMNNSANPDDIGWILPDYSVFDFIAAVYDGVSIRLYVNSDLIALYKASGVIADNALPLIIGGRSSDPNVENFKGIIDEVRIYNRALDASEIWQLYNDACQTDAECDNGAFCDGAEKCQNGSCVKGQSPCTQRQTCDETANRCLDCIGDAQCDDGVFCNGMEKCVNGICGAGTNPCAADQTCDETANRCLDCIGDAQCDDGIFCNGREKCNNGTCVTYPSCAEAQLCKEEQDECWEVKTITATCLQRSITCPILQEQKRTWMIMYSFAEHHCDPGTSRLEVSGAGTDFHGIQIDARRPFKIFGFIFIPLNIDRDASVGQWNIQITTDLDSTKTEERIVAGFKIR